MDEHTGVLTTWPQACTVHSSRRAHHSGSIVGTANGGGGVLVERRVADRDGAAQLLDGPPVIGGRIAREGGPVDGERGALVCQHRARGVPLQPQQAAQVGGSPVRCAASASALQKTTVLDVCRKLW